ncbi:endo alpha-1,4 polygalactosaminidase [Rhodoferax sp.]|uniref:bifunctional glycoside hydrolase 114/ polysaccharide deacetylase family protein n=1 Tax=Rhodoferax sp. TaxID=50421 RepID=UPI0025E98FC4|nr:endo alpha-1,4 polygalactosaminidase [Rhodoferax sp.]
MKKIFAFVLAVCTCAAYAQAAVPSVALYYGASPPWELLRSFDTVVVDPGHVPSPRTVASGPRELAAYVSVGEVQPSRPYAGAIPTGWLNGENKDWGSRLIDQSQAMWPAFFSDRVIKPLWVAGYRSFFFDTLDSYHLFAKTPKARAAQEAGLVELVREVKRQYPEARLIFNRGFEILGKTHQHVSMVAAESVFQGYDAGKSNFRIVPEADRQWLLGQLDIVKDTYKLPVLAIDYVPAHERALARSTADKIKALGYIPWVTTPDLMSVGVGNVEAMPRKVLVVHSTPTNEAALRYLDPVRMLSLPLNYLGYVPEFVDASRLPAYPLKGRYAGIAIWQNTAGTPGQAQNLSNWLQKQVRDSVPVAWLNMPASLLDNGLRSSLGISITPTSGAIAPITVTQQSGIMGFERSPTPALDSFVGLAVKDAQPLLTLAQGAQTQMAAAITPWGGYVSPPFVTSVLPGDLGSRWVVNPFDFLSQALQLPDMPVPDTTTETGKRMLMVHMDGDGFISRSETPGFPIAGEVVRDRIVRQYPIPMTISVIEAEVAPDGLYPGLSGLAEKVARDIFAEPHVAIASHSYSHPFFWYKASSAEGVDSYNLRIPGYRFNVKREIDGSIAYIERRLAPLGKKVEVFLWTGDCIPTSEALRAVAAAGLVNMNGGDTVATRSNPSVTYMEGLGLQRDGGFQVFAPNQNENVYTNNWQGPYYEFERVIETFELTGSPRRLKPINIYFHTYLATKRAGIQTLEKIFRYAMGQPVTPVHIADYARKVADFQNLSIARTADGWQIRGAKSLRSFRLPASVPTPNLEASRGIAGHTTGTGERFVHLSADTVSWVSNADGQDQRPLLVSANARVTTSDISAKSARWGLSGHAPLRITLQNVQHCEVRSGGRKLTPQRQDGALSHFELTEHAAPSLEALCRN